MLAFQGCRGVQNCESWCLLFVWRRLQFEKRLWSCSDIWIYKIYSLSAVLIFFIVLDFFCNFVVFVFPYCAIILTSLHRVLMINRCFVFSRRLVTHKHVFFIFKVLLKFGLSWLRRLRNSESLCPLGLSGLGSAVGLNNVKFWWSTCHLGTRDSWLTNPLLFFPPPFF